MKNEYMEASGVTMKELDEELKRGEKFGEISIGEILVLNVIYRWICILSFVASIILMISPMMYGRTPIKNATDMDILAI